MISTERTQSATNFRANLTETLDRINETGEAEIITVNGQARGVILSPAVYDELAKEALLARDVEVIRRSVKQYEAGEARPLREVSQRLRNALLAKKAAQANGKTKRHPFS